MTDLRTARVSYLSPLLSSFPKIHRHGTPKDIILNKFRLYFLCERGHSRLAAKSPITSISQKHEGNEINRPKELFQQYDSYVLVILRMLKFGVTVTGVAIPAATLLVLTEALDRATSSLKMLQEKIKSTYILDVGLYWDSTSQLSQAAGYPCAIQRQCTEAHVNLNLNGDHNSRHDSLFDLMRHPSTQSVVILGPPKDFFQGSKLLSQNEGFLNLRHLEIDISSMKEDIQASKD